jgi:hypothetical protein
MQLFAINTVKSQVVEQGTLKTALLTENAVNQTTQTFTVPANKKWIIKGASMYCNVALVSSNVRIAPAGAPPVFDNVAAPASTNYTLLIGQHNIVVPAGGYVRLIGSTAGGTGNWEMVLMYVEIGQVQ